MKNVNKLDFWEDIYKKDDIGWDLNGPTPTFEKIASKLKPGKVIILGCGRGHDAITFARFGFEVTAVDFAPSAISYLKSLCIMKNVKVNIIQNDIFLLGRSLNNYFDYVIEQTCYCAIDPNRREQYERLIYRILKPDGCLIGLWYPIDKPFKIEGHHGEFSISNLKDIFKKNWKIIEESFSELSVEKRKKREKLITFKKR